MHYIVDLKKSTDLYYQLHAFLTVVIITLGVMSSVIIAQSDIDSNIALIIGALLIFVGGFMIIRTIAFKKRYGIVIEIDDTIRSDGSFKKHLNMVKEQDDSKLYDYYLDILEKEIRIRDGRKNRQLAYSERVYLTLIHYEKESLKKRGIANGSNKTTI